MLRKIIITIQNEDQSDYCEISVPTATINNAELLNTVLSSLNYTDPDGFKLLAPSEENNSEVNTSDMTTDEVDAFNKRWSVSSATDKQSFHRGWVARDSLCRNRI